MAKHRVDSGWAKFLKDNRSNDVELLHYDPEYIQAKVKANDKKIDWYLVECYHGYWRCQCVDYNVQEGRTKDVVGIGSFLCKHIEEVHFKIAELKGVFNQIKLSTVLDIKKDTLILEVPGYTHYIEGAIFRVGVDLFRVEDIKFENESSIIILKKEGGGK